MYAFDTTSLDSIVKVIQSSLTPIFLLTAVASLLSVFTTRLARISDQVHTLAECETDDPADDELATMHLTNSASNHHLLVAASDEAAGAPASVIVVTPEMASVGAEILKGAIYVCDLG